MGVDNNKTSTQAEKFVKAPETISSRPLSKQKTDIETFQELNAELNQKHFSIIGNKHILNLISKTWISEWRNNHDKKSADKFKVLNDDLVHFNPYQLAPMSFLPNEFGVTRKSVTLNSDYAVCTDKAWEFLAQRFKAHRIQKAFYFNNNQQLVQKYKPLALNAILLDEYSVLPETYLLQFEDSASGQILIDQISTKFKLQIQNPSIYLLDARLELAEILSGIKDGNILYGHEIPLEKPFPFSALGVKRRL